MDPNTNPQAVPSQGFSNPFTNIPLLSKGIAATLVFMYLTGIFVPLSEDFLALVPGYTIPPHFYIWNVLTAGYFEISLFSTLLDSVAVLFIGKFLEPIWGSKEYLRFIVIVNVICGICTFLFMVLLYYIMADPDLWFESICGFSSVIAGFTVAAKQIIPEQEIRMFCAISVRAKYLSGILILINLTFLLLGISSHSFSFTFFGVIVSWTYLRFFQKKGNATGDMSDSFSFASFFPDIMQPSVTIISNIIYKVFLLCRCCTTSSSTQVPSTPSESVLPTHEPTADSERRRLRALKALDQRMQQMKQPTQLDSENDKVMEV